MSFPSRVWKVGASLALALSLLVPAAAPTVLAQVATATPTPLPRGAFFPDITVGNPTGPTPPAGGINAQSIDVNGTPVLGVGSAAGGCLSGTYPNPDVAATCVPTPAPTETPQPAPTARATDTPIPAPTAFPTCASSVVLVGTGAQGAQCGPSAATATPAPTDTPIPAPTAFPTCAATNLLAGTGGQGIQCGLVTVATSTPASGQALIATSGSAASFQTISGTGLSLIADTTLGASATNVTFSSIPGTSKHLILKIQARSNWAAHEQDNLVLQFNADTAGNYDYASNEVSGAASFPAQANAQTNVLLFNITAASATSGVFGAGEINIPNYADTTVQKSFTSLGGFVDTGAGSNDSRFEVGNWRSTAAITTVKLFPLNATDLTAGTRMTLYVQN